MVGAIAGDIIGSVYERASLKTKAFPLFSDRCRFTDDTVMTVAVADAILTGAPYDRAFRACGRRHPHAGYGGTFIRWLHCDAAGPYNSWGHGSAMRASAIGYAFDADTLACIAGAFAEAFYGGVPEAIRSRVLDTLTADVRGTVDLFVERFALEPAQS